MRPNVNGRKTRLIYAGAGVTVLAVPATALALTAGSSRSGAPAAPTTAPQAVHKAVRTVVHKPTARTAAQRGCDKLFTVKMAERAGQAVYAGDTPVTEHQLKVLGYIEQCQRNPAASGFVRGYDRHQARLHLGRAIAAHAAAEAAAAAREQAATQPTYQTQESSSSSSSSSQSQTPVSSPSSSSSQQSSGGSGGYSIPSSVVQCESGGNWSAVNPSSGAGGAYQILPSTWQAYGGSGLPQDASPAQQSAIASKIWAGGAGASQWSCAG